MERPQTAPKYAHVIQQVCAEAEVTYLKKNLRNHVQKDCVFGIFRLFYGVIMCVALDVGFAQNHGLSPF